MIPTIQRHNKKLSLTPEHKISQWLELIRSEALSGNKVKLYSDIESTGFAHWESGRPPFDEVMDGQKLQKDAEKFFIEIESMNQDFILNLDHPLCKSSNFSMKSPSNFSIFIFGLDLLVLNGHAKEKLCSFINDNEKGEDFYKDFIKLNCMNIYADLLVHAKMSIRLSISNAYFKLKDEAIKLSGKRDRMIEFALVVCCEDRNGKTTLLVDSEKEPVFFHEFILPDNTNIDACKIITEMPIIPYIIHKTSFSFLRGEEIHPFLGVKLKRPAPSASVVFDFIEQLFTFNYNKKDEELVSENIMMFFHYGNGFDIPFLDSELNNIKEGQKIRNFVQIYDTLKIAKAIIPADIQKFISNFQSNSFFGGDESIKANQSKFVQPTSKSLDNIRRLTSYLAELSPEKPEIIYLKKNEEFFENFKAFFEKSGIKWHKFESMLEYKNEKTRDLNLTKGFPSAKKSDVEYSLLLSKYLIFFKGRKEYKDLMLKASKHKVIYENLKKIKETIENNQFIKDALYRLNHVDRSVHGARIDSQLFMDAFIVLESLFYIKTKMSATERGLTVPIEINKVFFKELLKIKNKG